MSDVHSDSQIDMFNDAVRVRDGEMPDTPFGDAVLPESHSTSVAAVPFMLRNLKSGQNTSRSELMKELTKHIPLNEYSLPLYFYRPDLLDPSIIMSSVTRGDNTFVNEIIESALIPISYDQGFPTLPNQKPLWGHLDFETQEAYNAFLQYLEQPGIRTLHALTFEAPELLESWFHIYYWPARAKAYDMFRAAHHSRLREHRIMSLESDHFLAGERIFKRLNKAIEGKSDEDLEKLNIDDLIKSLERIAKIQRSSVGLSAAGNSKDQEQIKNQSVEVVMRSVSDGGPSVQKDDSFDVTMFDDLETVQKAQELIIRVGNR